MAWEKGIDLLGKPSGMSRHRLEQALHVLDIMGVRVPPTGRHRQAIRVIQEAGRNGPVSLQDRELLTQMAIAEGIAYDTTLIAAAAYGSRHPETPFKVEKLRRMMKGSFSDNRSGSPAGDMQFELLQAAMFRLGGVDTFDGEPDIQIMYGRERVGVAVKRIRSLERRQIRKHVKKAAKQI